MKISKCGPSTHGQDRRLHVHDHYFGSLPNTSHHQNVCLEWLRAKAEGENIRRRSVEELDKMRKFAVENFAESLLSVMDSLQAVLADNSGNIDTMKQGIDLTLKQLQSAFDKQKISAVNPVGENLDPSYHQAISSAPSDKPANTVIEVMQKGYIISDRLLRPALVVVSSGS